MAVTINASTSAGLVQTADTSGVLQLQTAGTTAVTVNASQNVGIGTASPAGDVTRYLNIVGSGGAGIFLHDSNQGVTASDGTTLQAAGVNTYLYNREAGFIAFGTSDIERMRIDSSGRVMINGTDAASTWHYTGKFHVKSDAGSGSTVMSVRYAGTSAFRNISIENDNGQVGYIQTSSSTTTYSTSSDYRLKENILPMTNALDKVMQLNPVTFTWKSDGSDGQGFIAHELQTIIPDAVGGQKDAVREDGTPDYQGVDTSFLVATLTAAIQEQQTIINELKARVTALEGAA
jgi:hypothetical protein